MPERRTGYEALTRNPASDVDVNAKISSRFNLANCRPMTRDEERGCATEYARTRAPALAKSLIAANMRLVVMIAHGYRRSDSDMPDLVQEGNLGLIQAVVRFDPLRGVRLGSYAAWWIRAYILKYTLDNWRLVKVGSSTVQRRLFFNLRKERDALQRRGIDPDSQNLAQALDVQEKDVAFMLERFAGEELSLEAPKLVRGNHVGTLGDTLDDKETPQPDVQVEAADVRARLRYRLGIIEETLAGRELVLFRRRLLNDEPATLAELASEFGVSRERTRQLEYQLKVRLRRALATDLGDAIGGGHTLSHPDAATA